MKHTEALHHFHTRKRIHEKNEPYPHPNKWKRFMDKAIYIIGILGPILTIPQVTKIWIEKKASGVSVFSWGAYLVLAVFWVMYGIIHKEKPIVLTYGAWIFLDFLVMFGAIIYG